MMALKFKQFSLKALLPFILIAIVALVSALFLGWLAVTLSFVAYTILSLYYK
jgi:CDP-diacylglycerol--serine O-phosphatidyltransferase